MTQDLETRQLMSPCHFPQSVNEGRRGTNLRPGTAIWDEPD